MPAQKVKNGIKCGNIHLCNEEACEVIYQWWQSTLGSTIFIHLFIHVFEAFAQVAVARFSRTLSYS